jgi:hypothetical protein
MYEKTISAWAKNKVWRYLRRSSLDKLGTISIWTFANF